ncbi:MAG: hypothetical protein LBT97_04040 [Planctomycetota bacterium]|jgi:tetratricopeptide (TPR) repeat protein|nr:hypothetical protein [Planctomycetota bacterium]
MASPTQNGIVAEADASRKASAFGAVMLWTISLTGVAWLATVDFDWKSNHDIAIERGDNAQYTGDYGLARMYYQQAVRFNPYSADAHRMLATLYDRRFADNENALRHFLYARKYDPERRRRSAMDDSTDALDLIRAGVIEDPMDALSDMETAVGIGSLERFRARIGPAIEQDAETFYQAWIARGPGRLSSRRMIREADGGWRAVLDLYFDDGAAMSMHFRAAPTLPWRMTLSFP